MHEHEHEPQPRKYSFEWQGEEIVLDYKNSMIFLHLESPQYDHIYVQLEKDPDEPEMGFYLWRRVHENFDLMVNDLSNDNCSKIVNDTVSEHDLGVYNSRFLGAPERVPEPEQPPEQPENKVEMTLNQEYTPEPLTWISQRRERQISNTVDFMLYLAMNNQLD